MPADTPKREAVRERRVAIVCVRVGLVCGRGRGGEEGEREGGEGRDGEGYLGVVLDGFGDDRVDGEFAFLVGHCEAREAMGFEEPGGEGTRRLWQSCGSFMHRWRSVDVQREYSVVRARACSFD